MKHFFLFLVLIFFANILFAQYQIAVYHPADKTTKIAPTFDSAYTLAQAGDYIYLPAGNFSVTNDVAKKLNIIGVGIDPDSSLLGITTFSSVVRFTNGSGNSFIEGIAIPVQPIYLGLNVNDLVSNIIFQRCNINQVIAQKLATNITFNECIIKNITGSSSSNWVFSKCIIIGVNSLTNSSFTNGVFNINSSLGGNVQNITNSLFYNNIFNGKIIDNPNYPVLNCTFFNNINTQLAAPTQNQITNNYNVAWASIFVNAKADSVYNSNYHLASGNPGINGGNDATDVGIYGTGQSCKPGWIPSNPHVAYKKISVDANGVLHATFKVQPQIY